MSGQQNHPYHLVDPSPIPILTSFAMMVMFLGLGLTFHGTSPGHLVLSVGVLSVIVCCYLWWRDVIREGVHDKAHNFVVQRGLSLGMGLFITSEVMFFVVFFWGYFNAALYPLLPLTDTWAMGQGVWPPEGIKTFDPLDLPFINTLVLLLSGTTVTWAHHAIKEGHMEDVKTALWLSVGLGVFFTLLQAYEYSHAAFGLTDGVYASAFYLATGFHGIHVIVGTLFLAVCLRRAYTGTMTKEGHLGFEFAAWYWHFVDVVWLFLFVAIYVAGA